MVEPGRPRWCRDALQYPLVEKTRQRRATCPPVVRNALPGLQSKGETMTEQPDTDETTEREWTFTGRECPLCGGHGQQVERTGECLHLHCDGCGFDYTRKAKG